MIQVRAPAIASPMAVTLRTDTIHFGALDSWRGLCAILVALFHLSVLGHIHDVPLIRNAFLFVDFFFVLSGFVITHAYLGRLNTGSEFTAFAIKRLGRIWPLHVVVLAAFVLAEAVNFALAMAIGFKTGHAPFAAEGYRPLAAIPAQLLLLQAVNVSDKLTWNFPSWSIGAELDLSRLWLDRAHHAAVADVCAGCGRAARGGGRGIVFKARHRNHLRLRIVRCLYGFTVGHLTYLIYRTAKAAPSQRFGTAIEVGMVALICGFVVAAGRGPLSLAAPLLFGLTVLIFAYERGLVSRMLKWPVFVKLGELSYSIYMVHAFVALMIMTAATIGQKLIGRPLLVEQIHDGEPVKVIANLNVYVLDAIFVAYIGIVIGLSALTRRLVEIPGQRLFGRWAQKAASAPRPAAAPLGPVSQQP
ncbi:acyltransferase family protein [Rhodopseudomonas palustris]|uniref:Acyltransferase n=1 Tax=Rhodopseudomonas palustris (strain ATCC BAA-98 / CGA009) TaxID=258594 RepID=Q6N7V0_RHOPA|nr:acyltransferase [Rhodopseudomonas palustris]WAB79808.1 acyltransferase [Rhodopseudomonas palustris]WCL92307.1 acyltransferase [Rhodopseudomonas palustris CGA009]WND53699.1 acyltransferase [Rhodopseudomonas palustris]CAE27595.1 putative acyltransferase [Rhodopseudomonas palustris CGA009]